MVLFSKVQEFVKEVNAGMANVYWLQLLRTMSANASDPFSLQTAKLVCWFKYIYFKKPKFLFGEDFSSYWTTA